MGITIHWEGKEKSKENVDKAISYAKFFAESLGWDCEYLKYKSITYNDIIRDTQGNITHKWLTTDEYDRFVKSNQPIPQDAVITESEGVCINPKKPFATESISLMFSWYKDGYLLESNFCKTQVFGDHEIANLIAHQLIISMLLTMKQTWIKNMDISDEGDYYKSPKKQSKKELEESIKYWKEYNYPQELIDRYTREHLEWQPFNFETLTKAHGGNLSMIRGLTGQLANAGFSKDNILTPAQKDKSIIEGENDRV